jgi:hypothetical protein
MILFNTNVDAILKTKCFYNIYIFLAYHFEMPGYYGYKDFRFTLSYKINGQ